jgi:DNA (cytosine-5)-methyltransferase 1
MAKDGGWRIGSDEAAAGHIIANALTRNMAGGGGGADDNTAQGGHLVPVAAEVYQQQGSNVGPMGTLRAGNADVTGGVPFVATTITAREGKGPDSDMTSGNLVTHALTAVGADASEDETGRGVPIVPVAYALRADPGGVGQGHNTNYVPVDLAQVTSGENRSNPQAGDPAGTLAATSRPAVAFGEIRDVSTGEDVTPAVRTGHGGTQLGVVAFGHTNGIDEQVSESATPTLRAGRGVGGGAVAIPAAAVRRLTPVECERLQGFPDGWTAKRAELVLAGNRWESSGKVLEQADSARYRQLGNSVAVPVFGWVAAGMVMVDETENTIL